MVGERCVMPVISVLSPSSLSRATVCPCGAHTNLSLVLFRTLASRTDPYKEKYVF
jgi:hypothetical protein